MLLRCVFRPSGKLFLCGLLALGLSCAAAPAFAAAAGCDPDIWEALKAKAEAQVAYDVAVTRSIIDKPDSVLALSCFDRAAGVSARRGGAIFGGEFPDQLDDIMPVHSSDTYECTAIEDLWESIVDEGVNRGAPYATFDELVNGTLPAGGNDDFNAGWDAAADANVFDNLRNRVNTMPGPPEPPLNFSNDRSSCAVLVTVGLIGEGDCL